MDLYRWSLILVLAGFLTGCITTPDEVVMAPIHAALTTGNGAEVQRLAADPKQLSMLNEYGETPLLYAVKRGKTELARILLEKGADPDTPNPRSGETPLIAAVRNGDKPMVEKLLKAGASLDMGDNEGSTPLRWAVRKGNLALVKIISSETGTGRVRENRSLLLEAAAYGHSEVVDYFLSMGASPAVRSERDETPLILAARFGHPGVVDFLLKKRADVSAVDTDGASALTWAARMGRTDIVKLLAAAGADLNRLDSTGLTPLAHAVRLGHLQVVKFLLGERVSTEVNLSTGESLMYWAAFQKGIAEELRRHGAAPKRVTDESEKPIVIAAKYLWLAKFYENSLLDSFEPGSENKQDMLNCYQWSAEFFDMAAVVYDDSAEALRKKQAAADRTAIFLSLLSIANAQAQAQFQANQMAELSALGNPGSTGVGYGYGTYYTPAAFKKSYTGGIPGYLEAAEKCRQSAEGCRVILECYRAGDPRSESSRSCAEKGKTRIQHLK